MLQKEAGGEHEPRKTGGVVADARSAHDPVLLREGELVGVGKDDVGVGAEDRDLVVVLDADAADDVAGLVDMDVLGAGVSQPVADEPLSATFVMRGRGYSRQRAEQLELLLVTAPRIGERRPSRCLVHVPFLVPSVPDESSVDDVAIMLRVAPPPCWISHVMVGCGHR